MCSVTELTDKPLISPRGEPVLLPLIKMTMSQASPTAAELAMMHWDCAKLLELGVSEQAVRRMTLPEAREILKGLLYLRERYRGVAEPGL